MKERITMFLLSLITEAAATFIDLNNRPAIMIAHRTIGPIESHSLSPFIFEKLFKDFPVIDSESKIDRSNRTKRKHHNLEDKVKGHGVVEDVKKAVEEPKCHSYITLALFFVILLVVGISCFYIGKAAESKNYVRVPASN